MEKLRERHGKNNTEQFIARFTQYLNFYELIDAFKTQLICEMIDIRAFRVAMSFRKKNIRKTLELLDFELNPDYEDFTKFDRATTEAVA